jgi:hypothetical protein
MSRPPHPPRLYNSNYTWQRVQIMKLLIMHCLDNRLKDGGNLAAICEPIV